MKRDVIKSLRLAERYLNAACIEADQLSPTRTELAKLRQRLSAILTDIEDGKSKSNPAFTR